MKPEDNPQKDDATPEASATQGEDAASQQEDWVDEDFMPPVRAQFQELNNLGVVSVVVGAASILTTFSWICVVLPIAGIALALTALSQIKKRPDVFIGRGFALTGLWLSIVFWILGTSFFVLGQRKGIPWGYELVTFNDLQPEGDDVVPPRTLKLQEDRTKIYIRGYMYPGRRYTNLKEFFLVPSIAHCNFCQQDLASTEIIRVVLEGDETTNHQVKRIGIGGRLTVDEAEAASPFGGVPYTISVNTKVRVVE